MTRRTRVWLVLGLAALVATLVATSCSSDDSEDTGSAPASETAAPSTPVDGPSTTAATTELDPAEVPVFTSAELCDLVPAQDVGEALGVEITEAEPFEGTPQCTYTFSGDEGVTTNVVLAVPRPVEELGGLVGEEAYDQAVELNQSLAGADAVVEEVPSVGSGATWLSGAANSVLLAWADDQVVTIAGTPLTQEQAAALAVRLLSAVT